MRVKNFYKEKATGNIRVIFNGICVLPVDIFLPSFTLLITVVPVLLQVLLINTRFVESKQDPFIDKDGNEKAGNNLKTINIVIILLLTISVCSLLAASMTEPGVIPRKMDKTFWQLSDDMRDQIRVMEQQQYNYFIDFEKLQNSMGNLQSGKSQVVANEKAQPRIEIIENNTDLPIDQEINQTQKQNKYAYIYQKRIELKYCTTCHIIKTPRVFHCNTCGVCVGGHDHHCGWLGTCIGQRNHKYFLCFIWTTLILALTVLILNIWMISQNNEFDRKDQDHRRLKISQIFMAIYAGLVSYMLVLLSPFHIFIACKNQSTQELIRDKYRSEAFSWGGNPYDHGFIYNWRYFLNRQKSLILEDKSDLFNQHEHDLSLMYKVQIEEEQHQSKESREMHIDQIKYLVSSSRNEDNKDQIIEKSEQVTENFDLKDEQGNQINIMKN